MSSPSPPRPSRWPAAPGRSSMRCDHEAGGDDAAVTDPGRNWRSWKERIFGTDHMIWHDGLRTDGVAGLRGEPRAQAIAMLRLGVSLGDSHAGQALAAMGEADEAAAIREQMPRASGDERVRLALAVHRLRPDPALARELVAVLRSRQPLSTRIDAAIGLRFFGGADDEAALLDAVGDIDYLVRYHACESLLARWGFDQPEIARQPEIFPLICGDHDAARHAEARALLERLKAR